ncbi:hypothetical protein IJG04_02780 [Candidatus Saccharibacteria bacterium]|nr:hypothetical protein [Candidatus Saccharibacteria bacterium]
MSKTRLHVTSAILILISAGMLIACGIVLLGGRVKKSGQNPDVELSDVLDCHSDEVRYPFLEEKIDEMSHNTDVNLVFVDGAPEVVGLNYEVKYVSSQRANEAFQMLTPEFNMTMDEMGLNKEFISKTKLSKNDNSVILKISVRGGDIKRDNADFLLIDDSLLRDGALVKEKLLDNYEKLGFVCKKRNNI